MLHIVLAVDKIDLGGGLWAYTEGLYNELVNKNISCSIVTSKKGFDKSELEEILQFKKVVIHINGLWTPFLHKTVCLAIAKSVPFLISAHGMLEPWALSHKFLKKRIAWYLYQKRDIELACAVHATSNVEMENIRKLNITTSVALVPNAVVLPFKSIEHKKNKSIRRCLFLSRIHPVKGLLDLVDAWSIVKPDGWELVIAGPDDDDGYKNEVDKRIELYDLRSIIKFVGPVYNIEKEQLYCQSDLFVLPTYSENFGLVIAEAMSYGLPVITTKAAPWSIIKEYDCGWWVDVGVESLVVALRQCFAMTQEELWDKGEISRKVIADNYTWPQVGSQMIELYEWIESKNNKPEFVM